MNEYEQAKKATNMIQELLSAAHQTAKAKMEASPLTNAISSYDREKAIARIHQYVNKYKHFINATYPLTGRFVVYAEGYYDDKADEIIKTDLQFLVLMVYLKYAGEHGLSKFAEKAIEKIFGKMEDSLNG